MWLISLVIAGVIVGWIAWCARHSKQCNCGTSKKCQ